MKNELRKAIREIVASGSRAIRLYREDKGNPHIINFQATDENYILCAVINKITYQINICMEEECERIRIIMFPSPRILPDNEKVINNAAIFCNELNCLTAFGKSSWHPNFFLNRWDGDIAISTFVSFKEFCVDSMELKDVVTAFYDYFYDISRPLQNILLEGSLDESLKFINNLWQEGYVDDGEYDF